MKNPIRTGTMIAIAAAGLFASACTKKDDSSQAKPAAADKAPAAAEKTAANIHCDGANACKGHGSCKSAANACAGQNGCKGKSFIKTATEDDCKAKGGTVVAAKM
ncbi:MAG: hypothetical protein ABI591_33435 [Kofleriaceae bacterium]